MTNDHEKIVAIVMALAKAYNENCRDVVLSDLVKAVATFSGNVIFNLHDNVSGDLDEDVIAAIEDDFCDVLADFVEMTIAARGGTKPTDLSAMKCEGQA